MVTQGPIWHRRQGLNNPAGKTLSWQEGIRTKGSMLSVDIASMVWEEQEKTESYVLQYMGEVHTRELAGLGTPASASRKGRAFL